METRKLNNNNLTEYDALVSDSLEGTIFHTSYWLSVFKCYYGNSYNVDFYGIFDDSNNLISGFPIPSFSKFGIKYVINPSLTSYLGPFYISGSINKKMCDEITYKKKINEEFAKILCRSNCMHYPFHYSNTDLQPFRWNDLNVGVEYTYVFFRRFR